MSKWAILASALTFLFIAMVTSCVSSSNDRQVVRQMDALFTPLWPDDAPGAAVLVLKGSEVVFQKGYGLATLHPDTPVQPSTFFCIASVSKQFAAVAIMKLAQAGKLSLDDPVSKWFPQFRAPFFSRITLRHLLSHTSGIPDDRPRTDPDFVFKATDEASYAYMDTLSTLHFEPGTQYEYMNPTFQLFYTLIEKASGMPFEAYMQQEVFRPAGMKETAYFEPDRALPRLSHGYEWDDESKTWVEYDYGEASFFATKADGALYTSVQEFVAWEMALRQHLLIDEAMTEQAHTAHIATDIPYTGYGYGWFIEEKPGFPKKVYHTGDNGGYQIYAGRYPEQEMLVLIFSTRNIDREGTVSQVDEIMKKGGWLR